MSFQEASNGPLLEPTFEVWIIRDRYYDQFVFREYKSKCSPKNELTAGYNTWTYLSLSKVALQELSSCAWYVIYAKNGKSVGSLIKPLMILGWMLNPWVLAVTSIANARTNFAAILSELTQFWCAFCLCQRLLLLYQKLMSIRYSLWLLILSMFQNIVRVGWGRTKWRSFTIDCQTFSRFQFTWHIFFRSTLIREVWTKSSNAITVSRYYRKAIMILLGNS